MAGSYADRDRDKEKEKENRADPGSKKDNRYGGSSSNSTKAKGGRPQPSPFSPLVAKKQHQNLS